MYSLASNRARHQRGSALVIAIVLLLLAALISVLTLNVGAFEQRSSGNDLRAKVVKQTAEAGLTQGFEYLMRVNPGWADDTSMWEACLAADETFPCGAVPAAVRASMFRLKANVGGYVDAQAGGLAAELTRHMLKTDSNSTVGAFDVAYGVAPVLCRVALPVTATNINCATGMANLSDRRVVTFVSVAQIRGDSGRSTLVQTVARNSLLAQGAGVPSLIATGTVTPNGNGDVVAMPNAAGPGLDISIWSRLNVDMKSAFGTCDRQTFLSSSAVSLSDPDWREKSIDGGCPKKGDEGWDILDVDSGAEEGVNKNVVASEFPCDLFEYAFGVKTWTDTNGDSFCETRLPRASVEINGQIVSLYPDEAFLYANASQIIGDNLGLARADQIKANPNGSSSGLIWCKSGCDKGPPGKPAAVGSPANPVVFVADGEMQTNGTIFYGMVFMRDPNASASSSTGGAAAFKQNGSKAAVFGSVFIQGAFVNGSGNGPIVGDPDIMMALSNNPSLAAFNTLRGGWTDRYSY
ncbi:PilX N-terminal domain-containing pilus assembly protein [Aerolutibacter ruishenii]|uniref:PilX-like prepilin protein n=1 Tax=Aerolutibacter ruishenii TaxID=686800 RepID=A0A562LSS5_9GAMM|nr:PilX N-terminal domain-containing pilus assembly protein [Lysobacter ruishenii]TWI10695.1 PilX-like prepilin protein [Lysobacter ruishenii]